MWEKNKTSICLAVSFILALSAFWLLPQLAFVVFIALLIDLLLHPLVDHLHQVRYIPRSVGAALSLFCFVTLATGLIAMLSSTLAASVQKFTHDLPTLTENIRELFSSSAFLSQEIDNLWTELASLSITAVRSSLTMLPSVFSKVLDIIIILFTAFYILKDGRHIQEWFARLFPAKDHLRVYRLFGKILRALNIYIYSQLAICFLMGIVVFCYFSLRGLPYAAVFAVVSGVSEFIPVIGPTIASAFGTALALVADAMTTGKNRGAFLAGSFGAGKSHFMAVLHAILRHDADARSIRELQGPIATYDPRLQDKRFLPLAFHFLGGSSMEQVIFEGYVRQIRALHPDAPLPVAPETEAVTAFADGVLTGLDALAVGVAAWRLGAGRARKEDPVQAVAGVQMHARPGDTVRKGQALLTLHTATPERLDRARQALAGGIVISPADSPAARDAVARREAGVILDRLA